MFIITPTGEHARMTAVIRGSCSCQMEHRTILLLLLAALVLQKPRRKNRRVFSSWEAQTRKRRNVIG